VIAGLAERGLLYECIAAEVMSSKRRADATPLISKICMART
jgi:hypothetical protein